MASASRAPSMKLWIMVGGQIGEVDLLLGEIGVQRVRDGQSDADRGYKDPRCGDLPYLIGFNLRQQHSGRRAAAALEIAGAKTIEEAQTIIHAALKN